MGGKIGGKEMKGGNKHKKKHVKREVIRDEKEKIMKE